MWNKLNGKHLFYFICRNISTFKLNKNLNNFELDLNLLTILYHFILRPPFNTITNTLHSDYDLCPIT